VQVRGGGRHARREAHRVLDDAAVGRVAGNQRAVVHVDVREAQRRQTQRDERVARAPHQLLVNIAVVGVPVVPPHGRRPGNEKPLGVHHRRRHRRPAPAAPVAVGVVRDAVAAQRPLAAVRHRVRDRQRARLAAAATAAGARRGGRNRQNKRRRRQPERVVQGTLRECGRRVAHVGVDPRGERRRHQARPVCRQRHGGVEPRHGRQRWVAGRAGELHNVTRGGAAIPAVVGVGQERRGAAQRAKRDGDGGGGGAAGAAQCGAGRVAVARCSTRRRHGSKRDGAGKVDVRGRLQRVRDVQHLQRQPAADLDLQAGVHGAVRALRVCVGEAGGVERGDIGGVKAGAVRGARGDHPPSHLNVGPLSLP
jgi:hypothetical protein